MIHEEYIQHKHGDGYCTSVNQQVSFTDIREQEKLSFSILLCDVNEKQQIVVTVQRVCKATAAPVKLNGRKRLLMGKKDNISYFTKECKKNK